MMQDTGMESVGDTVRKGSRSGFNSGKDREEGICHRLRAYPVKCVAALCPPSLPFETISPPIPKGMDQKHGSDKGSSVDQ
jgi:hypothetical protein